MSNPERNSIEFKGNSSAPLADFLIFSAPAMLRALRRHSHARK